MSDETTEVPRRNRRFSLLDALVLVAGTAGALRFCQKVMAANDAGFSDPVSVYRRAREAGIFSAPIYILFWFEIAAPFVLCWGLSLAVLRWLPPRPDREAISRQPGSIACLTIGGVLVTLAIGWAALILPLIAVGRFVALGAHSPPHYNTLFRSVLIAATSAGLAVSASWMVLILCGRWQSSRDWIDFMGRALGVFAILSAPFLLWALLIVN